MPKTLIHNQTVLPGQAGQMPIWVNLLIIAIAVGASLVLIFYNNNSQTTPAAVSQPKESSPTIKTLIGTIRQISDGRLELQTSAIENNLQTDQIFNLIVDEQTQVTRLVLPKELPATIGPGDLSQFFQREKISLSQLTTGAQITVSVKDILNNSDLYAERIEKSVKFAE